MTTKGSTRVMGQFCVTIVVTLHIGQNSEPEKGVSI